MACVRIQLHKQFLVLVFRLNVPYGTGTVRQPHIHTGAPHMQYCRLIGSRLTFIQKSELRKSYMIWYCGPPPPSGTVQ